VTTFLQRLAAAEPHVVVLDDLHWADDPPDVSARLTRTG
jgi:predicted ATPase